MRPTLMGGTRLTLIFLLSGLLSTAWAADVSPGLSRFYVQLIRGSDDTQPPMVSARPIGPRLSKCLSSVFRWRTYWETARHTTTVQPGAPSKIHLDPERDLELALVSEGQVEARLLRNGALARKARFSSQTKGLEIMGGTQGDDSCWFVVVRRDEPQIPAVSLTQAVH